MSHFFAKSVCINNQHTMSSSNKRRRTTTTSNNNDDKHITDLPDGLLVGISSYLAKPSVALFALSMTADSDQQTETDTSKAIISSTNWNTLDFGDVEKRLAARLSDNDIGKILRCVDAVNNLRILKLAGCVNFTGSGLDVLRSSVVIQQIDLSLVGKHESPLVIPEPLLAEDVVLPILDDIISRGRRSSLKQLELPKKWRLEQSTQMTQFLVRYDRYLASQRYNCSKCDRVCVDEVDYEWIGLASDKWYGIQNFTCSECLVHFCYREDCEDENRLDWCKKCEKESCKSCSARYYCNNCEEEFCNDCKEMRSCGEDCRRGGVCDDCSMTYTCSFCGKMRCCDDDIRWCSARPECTIVACSECSKQSNNKCECGGILEGYL